MELSESLAAAGIVRVAVVDDDLSSLISTEDIRIIDSDVAALLNDPDDPDRSEYLELLSRRGEDIRALTDIAAPLADPNVLASSPIRIREVAQRVLDHRSGNAVSIRRVLDFIGKSGVLAKNIDTYHSPYIPADKFYDLVIVDYYLVNNSNAHTIPFLKNLVQAHGGQEKPLQLILMSSHEESLSRDFQALRPEMGVSSSRMRILAKPQSDEQILRWQLVLAQLAAERNFVVEIESFVTNAISAIEQTAKIQASKLWGLDLQAADVLYETAEADNDDYCRYMEECLGRHLLTGIEEAGTLRHTLEQLHNALQAGRSQSAIAPGVEIGDSRATVRALMASMEWRGGAPLFPPFPGESEDSEKAEWIKSVVRFGMVLRCPDGHDWLNLTQSCDLLQCESDDYDSTCLLLVRGNRKLPSAKANGQSIIAMSSVMADGDTSVLWWNLNHILSPTITSFGVSFGEGWSISGELRLDQAQNVAAKYAAQTSRVGLQRSVKSWSLSGRAMRVHEFKAANDAAAIEGVEVAGQALRKEKKDELHIDLPSMTRLMQEFGDQLNSESLVLCKGIHFQPTNTRNDKISPRIFYCPGEVPSSIGRLRELFFKEPPAWFGKDSSAGYVLLFLWAS